MVVIILLNAGIIHVCRKILDTTKDRDIKKTMSFFIIAISIAMLGNALNLLVGFGNIGIDGLRETVELFVLIFALFGVRHLGKYYEKKGK